jgi:hypothetical protein
MGIILGVDAELHNLFAHFELRATIGPTGKMRSFADRRWFVLCKSFGV